MSRTSKSGVRCLAEARHAMRCAAEHLKADPTVDHVDIIPPTRSTTGEHALEVTLAESERLRPAVLRTIASHDLDVDTCELFAAHTHRRAILRPR